MFFLQMKSWFLSELILLHRDVFDPLQDYWLLWVNLRPSANNLMIRNVWPAHHFSPEKIGKITKEGLQSHQAWGPADPASTSSAPSGASSVMAMVVGSTWEALDFFGVGSVGRCWKCRKSTNLCCFDFFCRWGGFLPCRLNIWLGNIPILSLQQLPL